MKYTLVALLIAMTVWAYRPAIAGGFVYEDGHTFQPPRWTLQPNRALSQWTYQLQDYRAESVHVANVGLHVLNGLLVGILAVQLGLSWWLAAGLFLLHPLNSEAVAYMTGRPDILVTFWALLAAVALLADRPWSPILAIGSLLCAAVSKESGVVVILICLLPFWMHPDWTWSSIKKFGLTVGLLVAGTGLPYVLTAWHASVVSPWLWMGQQMSAIWRHVGSSMWPLRLTADVDVYGLPSWMVLIAGCSIVPFYLVIVGLRRWPALAFASGWVGCVIGLRLIVPTPGSWMSEHQWYQAMPGMCLGLAALWPTVRNGEWHV